MNHERISSKPVGWEEVWWHQNWGHFGLVPGRPSEHLTRAGGWSGRVGRFWGWEDHQLPVGFNLEGKKIRCFYSETNECRPQDACWRLLWWGQTRNWHKAYPFPGNSALCPRWAYTHVAVPGVSRYPHFLLFSPRTPLCLTHMTYAYFSIISWWKGLLPCYLGLCCDLVFLLCFCSIRRETNTYLRRWLKNSP